MGQPKQKSNKPYLDFPLTAHNNGKWCKKIKGKVHFFEVWSDPDTALQNYCETRDDLQAGRQPGEIMVRDLVNHFLTRPQERFDRDEITDKTFADYHMVGGLIVKHFGKRQCVDSLRSTDCAKFRHVLGQRYTVSGLMKALKVVRIYSRWGYESDLIDKPIRFGSHFKALPKKKLPLHKASKRRKHFEKLEIQKMLAGAIEPL